METWKVQEGKARRFDEIFDSIPSREVSARISQSRDCGRMILVPIKTKSQDLGNGNHSVEEDVMDLDENRIDVDGNEKVISGDEEFIGIIGFKDLWCECLVSFGVFIFVFSISSVSISFCSTDEVSWLYFGLLFLVCLHVKVLNWNKFGFFGFYFTCVLALLGRNVWFLWHNVCSTQKWRITGYYLILWSILVCLILMKQILYLVSLNQMQSKLNRVLSSVFVALWCQNGRFEVMWFSCTHSRLWIILAGLFTAIQSISLVSLNQTKRVDQNLEKRFGNPLMVSQTDDCMVIRFDVRRRVLQTLYRPQPNHDIFMDQSDTEVKLWWQVVVFGFSIFQTLINSMSMLFPFVLVAFWLCISIGLSLFACNDHGLWYWNKIIGSEVLREAKVFGQRHIIGRMVLLWYKDLDWDFWIIWTKRASARQQPRYGIWLCQMVIQNIGMVQRQGLKVTGDTQVISNLVGSLRRVNSVVNNWVYIGIMAGFVFRMVIGKGDCVRAIIHTSYTLRLRDGQTEFLYCWNCWNLNLFLFLMETGRIQSWDWITLQRSWLLVLGLGIHRSSLSPQLSAPESLILFFYENT